MNTATCGCDMLSADKTERRAAAKSTQPESDHRMLSIATLVLWAGCASVAGLGFALAYPFPQAKAAEALPVTAEFLNIELSNDPQLLTDLSPRVAATEHIPLPTAPAALPDAAPAPAMANPIALQEPAFAIVEPATVTTSHAAMTQETRPAVAPAGAPRAVERIVFGRGEGRQPAPEYPFQAQRQGQQGTVQVRFVVGDTGRIVRAELAEPSPWPLLNEAALKAVKHTWRFSPGKSRLCQVSIHFTL